mgnify:CR=1 FL=1
MSYLYLKVLDQKKFVQALLWLVNLDSEQKKRNHLNLLKSLKPS